METADARSSYGPTSSIISGMSWDHRIGLAGLIVAFLAIAFVYRWPNEKSIGTVCLFIAAVLAAVWGGLELNLLSGVVISPSKISFNTPFTDETRIFTVTNTRDRDAYAVAFSLRIDSSDLTTKDFVLGLPKSSQKPMSEDANGSKIADTVGMACTDSRKRQVFTMSIYRLMRHESRDITMTRKTSRAVSISARILDYSYDAPLITGENRTMAPIYIAETLTCGSVFVLGQ